LDPLATGAILFDRGDYKFAAAGPPEETIWLLGIEGVRRWDNLKPIPPTMDSAALPAAGFYLLSAPQPATQLVMDAGPQGTQNGGHGHADALSVCLQSQGSCLLLDPGTYEYVGKGGDRALFRGTAMHNTLRVDGANQAESVPPFSWKRLTQSKAEQWMQGNGFDLIVASHDGYQRLVAPVIHRRWVLSFKNGMYLIRDLVEGQGKHQLDISWHLCQELQRVKENVFRLKGDSPGLVLLPAQGHGWAEEIRKEAWSPVYGQKAPMTVLNFGTTVTVPAEFAILLVTLDKADRNPGSFERLAAQHPDSGISAYRYSSEDADYSFLFGEPGKPWRLGEVSSDAEFVCWNRKKKTLIFCKGSYAAIEGSLELHCRRPVSWAEVTLQGSGRTVVSSDPEAL
jgi:hypothetical protein